VNPIVRGEPLKPEHAAMVFRHLDDAGLYTYIPPRRPESVEALEREFRRLVAGSQDGSQVWLNWLAVHSDHPVGTLQATVFADGSAILAYVIFREYQGRGFGREGARWVLHELFERRGVRRVLAYVDERNLASIRVALAIGMRSASGVDAEGADPGDRVFVLSADDWKSLVTTK
jgi:RimJ/RimL family protein N-acetyltransferase